MQAQATDKQQPVEELESINHSGTNQG